jgi:drug/metabolite transporter (DMT)-like permease
MFAFFARALLPAGAFGEGDTAHTRRRASGVLPFAGRGCFPGSLPAVPRSLFLTLSTVFNFLALRHLQLAETTTIAFAGAFVVAGLAGPMLGEGSDRRWAAIAVGFIGVVIVTRPGPQGIQPAVLLDRLDALQQLSAPHPELAPTGGNPLPVSPRPSLWRRSRCRSGVAAGADDRRPARRHRFSAPSAIGF